MHVHWDSRRAFAVHQCIRHCADAINGHIEFATYVLCGPHESKHTRKQTQSRVYAAGRIPGDTKYLQTSRADACSSSSSNHKWDACDCTAGSKDTIVLHQRQPVVYTHSSSCANAAEPHTSTGCSVTTQPWTRQPMPGPPSQTAASC